MIRIMYKFNKNYFTLRITDKKCIDINRATYNNIECSLTSAIDAR